MDHTSTAWKVTQTLSLVYARYAIAPTMTIVVLEYLQLLDLEQSLIWPSKWTLSKALFLANRYLPFWFVTIFLYYNSAPNSTSPTTCRTLFSVATVGMIIAALCADAVLYLRLYALSKQARVTKIVLITNYTLVGIVCVVGIGLFLPSETFVPSPNLLPQTPCFHWGNKATTIWLTVCYGALLYSSLFTTALSLWYGVKLYLSMRPMPPSTLIKIFHRDGAIYFVCIATISLVNAFIARVAPLQYRYLLSTTQGMVHSVLAARMILHLREVARQDVPIHSRSSTRVLMGRDAWAVDRESHSRPPANQPFELKLGANESGW
ncbi:hypothetical protein BKA70DRAFT_1286418 [Coprinopsis sp. MPI-PUGE-AT-0042]|nr:hypothetical protein BKA70DRAFT_1286418 [Coprinopsis sp. MPI-PUGE-AT-0042]